MVNRHSRYAFLDGIRGMAAIFVLTRHTGDFWQIEFFRSYLAVDLFFILSGFVIAYAYDEKLKNGTISAPKFFLIRLIRLYPVYLLSLALCSMMLFVKIFHHHLGNGIDTLGMIAMTALFLPSQVAGSNELFTINGPYWSLFFELLANAIYATIRTYLTDAILMLIVCLSGLMLAVITYHYGHLNLGFNWGAGSLMAGFFRSIFGVFCGLLLYRHHTYLGSILERFKFVSPWVAFIVIAVVLSSPSFGRFDAIIDILTVTVLFPICVLTASHGEVSRFQKLLLLLGSASYPIYVLHEPLGELISYVSKGSIGEYAPFSGIALVIILIVLSVGIEKWYDIPLRSWLSNYAFRRQRN